jgi:hypothetical protein
MHSGLEGALPSIDNYLKGTRRSDHRNTCSSDHSDKMIMATPWDLDLFVIRAKTSFDHHMMVHESMSGTPSPMYESSSY